MKLVVISDVHDNLDNLTKVLVYCQQNKIKQIICCGDLASQETLAFLAKFDGQIDLVFGNMDLDYQLRQSGSEASHQVSILPEQYKNLVLHQGVGELTIDQQKITFIHEPFMAKKYLEKIKVKPAIMFYGHTHKPWQEKYQGVDLVNPGNVANLFYAPSFAVYETANHSLKLVMINQL